MTSRINEVEAAVHSIIYDVSSVEAALVLQVALKLVIDVGNDAMEAVSVVDGIAVAGCVHYRQANLHTTLLDLNGTHIDLYSLLQVL